MFTLGSCDETGHFRAVSVGQLSQFWLPFLGDCVICSKNKKILSHLQIDVSFSCICPVIDHEFRHNIVKVVVDPRGDTQVDLQTTLTTL